MAALVALFALAAGGGARPACACRGPFPTWPEAVARADAIFVGTVTAVGQPRQRPGDPFGTIDISFSVERVWRGPRHRTVVVQTGNHTCGLRVEVGQQWAILAAGKPLGTGATSLDLLLRLADGRPTEHSVAPIEQALGPGAVPE
jgi:hypothetical protein